MADIRGTCLTTCVSKISVVNNEIGTIPVYSKFNGNK